MIKNKKTLLSTVVMFALTACGSGNSNQAAEAAGTNVGKAIDGYLSAASVLCDTNNNGIADGGETVTTTDSSGNFAFSPACTSPIVATGGTNSDTGLPFQGRLKALPGSSVVTPLTSLMASGMSSAQIVSALGLPAGTDISNTDPVGNTELQKKTLAMQQIIQQISNSLGGLGGNTSPAALQAMYSEVAKAVVATLTANPASPLVDANGNVSSAMVSGMVKQSVTNIATTSDASLATVKSTLSVYSGSSVASLISSAVASQAQTLSQTTDAASLTKLATELQASPAIAQGATQLAALLTNSAEKKGVNLDDMSSGLTQMSTSSTSSDPAAAAATALAAITKAATTQAAIASVPAPTIANLLQAINTLSITNDSIGLNGSTFALAAFESTTGVTLVKQATLIDTVSLGLTANGVPIPAVNGIMTTSVSMAVELTDTGSSGRVLQIMLDQANVTIDSAKNLSVSVPVGAKLYVYSKTTGGITGNLTLTNTSSDQFITVANNQLTFNSGKVVNRILSTVNAQPASTVQKAFANINNVSGTFNLKMVVSQLTLSATKATAVRGLSVSVTGSGQPAVSGLGVNGVVTITP